MCVILQNLRVVVVVREGRGGQTGSKVWGDRSSTGWGGDRSSGPVRLTQVSLFYFVKIELPNRSLITWKYVSRCCPKSV